MGLSLKGQRSAFKVQGLGLRHCQRGAVTWRAGRRAVAHAHRLRRLQCGVAGAPHCRCGGLGRHARWRGGLGVRAGPRVGLMPLPCTCSAGTPLDPLAWAAPTPPWALADAAEEGVLAHVCCAGPTSAALVGPMSAR